MENQVGSYHIQVLKRSLTDKKRVNEKFSLRSYAKFLGIDPGTLCSILNHKRALPAKYIEQVCERLNLSDDEKIFFADDIKGIKRVPLKEIQCVEPNYTHIEDREKNYALLSQWEYYAILHLIEADDFQPDIRWIAKRFSLTEKRVGEVVNDLISLKLIRITELGKWEKLVNKLTTTDGIRSLALRQSHKETLYLAAEKIESVPLTHRSYSSSVVCIDPNKIEEARVLIRNFRRSLSAFLEEGPQKEVYQLAVQLYPLTDIEKEEKA